MKIFATNTLYVLSSWVLVLRARGRPFFSTFRLKALNVFGRVNRRLQSKRTEDSLRVVLGRLLLTLWVGTFYSLLFKAPLPYEIYFGLFILGTAMAVMFVRWRSRYLARKTSEQWDPARGRGVAIMFAAVYFILCVTLALVGANEWESYIVFISISGASLGIFFLSIRIPLYSTFASFRWPVLHVFLVIVSAAFTVVGILAVVQMSDQASRPWLFFLMGNSAALLYYFGESLVFSLLEAEEFNTHRTRKR